MREAHNTLLGVAENRSRTWQIDLGPHAPIRREISQDDRENCRNEIADAMTLDISMNQREMQMQSNLFSSCARRRNGPLLM
jgi:hypothetical protein